MLPGVENLKTGQRKLTGFSFLMGGSLDEISGLGV